MESPVADGTERGARRSEITTKLVYTVDPGMKPVNETFGPADPQRRDTGEG